jgi:hypothetical protein
MDPLHAAIGEFAAEGFTHVACYCPRCSARSFKGVPHFRLKHSQRMNSIYFARLALLNVNVVAAQS